MIEQKKDWETSYINKERWNVNFRKLGGYILSTGKFPHRLLAKMFKTGKTRIEKHI